MKSNDTPSAREKFMEQPNRFEHGQHMQHSTSEEDQISTEHSSDASALTLAELGWDEAWERTWGAWQAELNETATRRYGASLVPARVALAHKGLYRVWGAGGEWLAEPSGLARAQWLAPSDSPAVGDWVAVAPRAGEGRATIAGVLPRRGMFARKVAGKRHDAQVIAANADIALLSTALGADFEPRRLERYAALAYDSGATPVVVLTTADAIADPGELAAYVAQAMGAVPGAEVFPVSSVTGDGLDALRTQLRPGVTCVLVGSSGVGKSTLVNALMGAAHMVTRAIREDDGKGRHTTTHRELVALPNGAWLIDTPGMREVGIAMNSPQDDNTNGIQHAFEEVEQFAEACRFNDCTHDREPGCAVQAALASGELDHERWQAYRKLQRELAYLKRSENAAAMRAHGRKHSKLVAQAVQHRNNKKSR